VAAKSAIQAFFWLRGLPISFLEPSVSVNLASGEGDVNQSDFFRPEKSVSQVVSKPSRYETKNHLQAEQRIW
jgi:hypothetical protein